MGKSSSAHPPIRHIDGPNLHPVQLLHKLSIRGVQGSEKLLRVIKVSFSPVSASR